MVFDPLLFHFCIKYKTDQFKSCQVDTQVLLGPFAEETIISPKYVFGTSVEDKMTICFYEFTSRSSIPLGCVNFFAEIMLVL